MVINVVGAGRMIQRGHYVQRKQRIFRVTRLIDFDHVEVEHIVYVCEMPDSPIWKLKKIGLSR